MSRTLKSESAAHTALVQHATTQAQTRNDWRTVLAARDAKRAAYIARNTRTATRHAFTLGALFASVAGVFSSIRFPSL